MIHNLIRRVILLSVWAASGAASAQSAYPDHPLSVVVAYPAGGYIDTFARIITARMSEVLGQPLIVANRPGAGGSIGVDAVMRAKPDGYTLFLHSAATMAIYSALNAEKPDSNFPPLSVAAVVAATPGVMSAPTALAKDFPSLIATIKAEPGKHAYGSAGVGTPSHLWSGQVVRLLGLDVQHVPFAGGGQALTELMAGRLAWTFDTPVGVAATAGSGKAHPVAVLSPKRVQGLMDIPTLNELGLPQISDDVSNLMIMAPPNTPREILAKLNAAFQVAAKSHDLLAQFDTLGSYIPDGLADLDLARDFSVRDYAKWFATSVQSGVRSK